MAYSESGAAINQHPGIFGSLISLDPNLVGQTSAGAIQSRRKYSINKNNLMIKNI